MMVDLGSFSTARGTSRGADSTVPYPQTLIALVCQIKGITPRPAMASIRQPIYVRRAQKLRSRSSTKTVSLAAHVGPRCVIRQTASDCPHGVS